MKRYNVFPAAQRSWAKVSCQQAPLKISRGRRNRQPQAERTCLQSKASSRSTVGTNLLTATRYANYPAVYFAIWTCCLQILVVPLSGCGRPGLGRDEALRHSRECENSRRRGTHTAAAGRSSRGLPGLLALLPTQRRGRLGAAHVQHACWPRGLTKLNRADSRSCDFLSGGAVP